MSPALANFLFEAGNFLLLAAVLGWLLFKPVRRALDAERERQQTQAQRAEQLRAEAQALADQARASKEAAQREVQAQREAILAAAGQRADALLEAARETAHTERMALQQELQATRKAETEALSAAVGRLAGEAVQQLLLALPGPSLDLALVQAACAELQALPADARSAALVESARPLSDEQRALLQRALGAEFPDRVVSELGAGVRITCPAGQVDATAAAFARRAARAVTRAGSETGTQPSARLEGGPG